MFNLWVHGVGCQHDHKLNRTNKKHMEIKENTKSNLNDNTNPLYIGTNSEVEDRTTYEL